MAYNYQAARTAGLSDQQIEQYLNSKGRSLKTEGIQTQQPQDMGFKLSSLLPVAGGILGGVSPLGPILGGGIGSTIGEGARQLIEGKVEPEKLVTEGALGLFGGTLGKVGTGAARLVGKGAAKGAENLGFKAFRLNPGQITKFATRHREDPQTFLKTEGALFKAPEQIRTQHIDVLQNQFNKIAKKSGLKADINDFLKNVDDSANELIEAGGSENTALAKKIQNEALFIWENNFKGDLPDISKIDQLRKTFASKVNWNNPEKAVLDYNIADALRKTAIDTADKAGMVGKEGLSLKDIGIKLSKYRDLDKSITAQEALGRGAKPIGITNWLSMLAGGAGFAGGGMSGATTGLAINQALGSPTVLRGIGSMASRAGNLIGQNGRVIPGAAQIAGQSSARIGGMAQPTTPEDGTMQPMEREVIPSSAQRQQLLTPEMAIMLMANFPKQASLIKSMLDISQGSANQQKAFGKIADAESIVKQISSTYSKLGGTGRISGQVKRLGSVLGFNPQATAYEALRKASIGPLARAISAEVGVLTDADVSRAEALLPKITDTPEEAKLKLQQLIYAINARRSNISNFPGASQPNYPAVTEQYAF